MNQTSFILSDEALQQNEEQYQELVESLNDVVFWISANGAISYVSPAIEHILGYRPEDLTDRNYLDLIIPEDKDRVCLAFEGVLNSKVSTGECRLIAKNGGLHWARISAKPTVLYQRIIGVQGVFTDITEQKKIEEALLSALLEKEAQVREVHHRVKNNFQAIIDLISSRLDHTSDEQTTILLKGLQEQVRTLALVHEQLCQSDNLELVNMKPYLHDLAGCVVETFGSDRPIELQVECDDFSLQARDAMPCGLMVNELLTNALKHAFPTPFPASPRLSVRLSAETEQCDLVVRDNGVGLAGEIDQLASGSLGLRLIELWAVHQLGGTLEVKKGEGTTFHIVFPRRKIHHCPCVGNASVDSNQAASAHLPLLISTESCKMN
jgi:PAS domain S-box-containing protein